jgi:signal transduction histidine kinase
MARRKDSAAKLGKRRAVSPMSMSSMARHGGAGSSAASPRRTKIRNPPKAGPRLQSGDDVRQPTDDAERLIYTVAHDLKSPLVSLLGLVGLLHEALDDQRTDEARQCLKQIQGTGMRMERIIADLMTFLRAGHVLEQPQPVALRDVLEAVVATSVATASRVSHIEPRITLEGTFPVLWTERARIVQVIENVIANSFAYGLGGPAPQLSIEGMRDSRGNPLVCVRDNGPGIDPDMQEHIFRLFARGQEGGGGSGVGLAIVRRAMAALGGAVWVESEPGRGAAFWLRFPAALVHSAR